MLSIPEDWRCVCFNSDFTMVHTIHTSFTRSKHPGLDQFVPKNTHGGAWQISLTAAWNKQGPLKKRLQTWGSKHNIKKSKQQNTHIVTSSKVHLSHKISPFFFIWNSTSISQKGSLSIPKKTGHFCEAIGETDHHPIRTCKCTSSGAFNLGWSSFTKRFKSSNRNATGKFHGNPSK